MNPDFYGMMHAARMNDHYHKHKLITSKWFDKFVFRILQSDINNINIYMVSSSMRDSDIKRASHFEELTGYVVKPVNKTQLAEIFKKIYHENW